MKAKIPKKAQMKQIKVESDQQQEDIQSESKQVQQINLFPRMIKKDSLFVTFSGTIQTGNFDHFKSLTLFFSFASGSDWKVINGKRTGQSQVSACNDQKILWNYPFQITYETTILCGWPQLLVVLYAHDFFGKPFVEGYGNVHLPTSGGLQKRRLRIFCPEARSIISGILGYFQGTIAEYRDYEKVLSQGDGREVTRTKSIGYIDIKVQTSKYNFQRFGYE